MAKDRDEARGQADEIRRFYCHEEGFTRHVKAAAVADVSNLDDIVTQFVDPMLQLNASQLLQLSLFAFTRLPIADKSVFFTECLTCCDDKPLLNDITKRVKYMVSAEFAISILHIITVPIFAARADGDQSQK